MPKVSRKRKQRRTKGHIQGTPMNGIKGISLNETPLGLSLNEPEIPNHPLLRGTFKTRKANAMRKKGLNLKGNPLGTSLNSLAIRVKVRKAQDQHQDQKNKTKKAIKGRITDRKKKALESILENMAQSKDHNKVLRELRKMEPTESPETILKREKAEASKKREALNHKMYKNAVNFEYVYGDIHKTQYTHELDPEIAKELAISSRKANWGKANEPRAIFHGTQQYPASNTNVPAYHGKLSRQ